MEDSWTGFKVFQLSATEIASACHKLWQECDENFEDFIADEFFCIPIMTVFMLFRIIRQISFADSSRTIKTKWK